MRRLIRHLCAAATLSLSASVALATNTFTVVSGNDWNTPANWSAGHVPTDGEDVVINGNVTLTNATAALASYTLNSGKSQMLDGWYTVLSAAVVNVTGTMTHTNNLATNAVEGVWVPNARVWIVCSNLTINTNGKIDVNYKGYQVGLWGKPGYGPGGGAYGTTAYFGYPAYGHGGGHGGAGGGFNELYNGTNLYGSTIYGRENGAPDAPTGPGSGGGGGDNSSQARKGHGGGAVRIDAAGEVTVNGGGILANGESLGYHMGGGSGGSIYITCRIFSGNGPVQAFGGAGTGGGGGGRVAVVYDCAAQSNAALPAVVFNVAGGKGGTGGFGPYDGDLGTLFFPDSQLLTRQTGSVLHSGRWMPSLTRWERGSLTLTNAWLRFGDGFQLVVTNDLSVYGTDNRLYRLELTNGLVSVGGNILVQNAALTLRSSESSGFELYCGGNLTLTNAAALAVYSAQTAAPSDYGALVSVTGDVRIAVGSWIYPHSHPTNGGAALFVINNLNVQTNAGFDASARGFRGGPYNQTGYGPGAGKGTGSGGGGGHGGAGGGGNATLCGITNDLYLAPEIPGSSGAGGGRYDMAFHSLAGAGGGVVRIQARGDISLQGSLLANGEPGWGWNSGGGAGGAILVDCDGFAGAATASLSANGGKGSGDLSGSGGGGRIAVWCGGAAAERERILSGDMTRVALSSSWDTYIGTTSVTNGVNVKGVALPGTAVFVAVLPRSGTLMMVN